ncbi:XRE family transcriptional regulator [Myroides sp. M-43]|uniref:XRE family transcriptional regulator n=1 Tax=Myroides oncorhynchi TaxID=2893756 RepID=UPI001E3EAAC4|nr:XRE family transcriptional regulator [Myroides oncorhynchi]MCC9043645.1 XRE family transcriptional regulator [Myroides oncorhynchi]
MKQTYYLTLAYEICGCSGGYIEIARKIADILEVSLDYLTGKEEVLIDKYTSLRILEVSKFEETDRNHIFSVIDAFIAKRKIQSIL